MTKKEFVDAFAKKGELKIKVEAKKVVKFKVGQPLADKVAEQKPAKKATKKK